MPGLSCAFQYFRISCSPAASAATAAVTAAAAARILYFEYSMADGRNAGDNWSVSMRRSEIPIIEWKERLSLSEHRFFLYTEKPSGLCYAWWMSQPRVVVVVVVRYLPDKDPLSRPWIRI